MIARALVIGEAEAGAADGVDGDGGAEFVEFAAEAFHHRVDVGRAAQVPVAPHGLVQSVVRPDPQRRGHQPGEQVVLELGELDLATAPPGDRAGPVDRQYVGIRLHPRRPSARRRVDLRRAPAVPAARGPAVAAARAPSSLRSSSRLETSSSGATSSTSSASRTRSSGEAATAISSGNGFRSDPVVVRSTSAGAGTRAVTIRSRCQPLPWIVNGLPTFDHFASIGATASHILLTRCACYHVVLTHKVHVRLAVSHAATWGARSVRTNRSTRPDREPPCTSAPDDSGESTRGRYK